MLQLARDPVVVGRFVKRQQYGNAGDPMGNYVSGSKHSTAADAGGGGRPIPFPGSVHGVIHGKTLRSYLQNPAIVHYF